MATPSTEDRAREVAVARPEDPALVHLAVVGDTANVPANAPHTFRNPDDVAARVLCTVAPAGLERFFAEFGDRVPTRTSPAPPLIDAERQERLRRAVERAPDYGMEILPPPAA